jgi:gamma-glutamylcyclotransferase (GGCT)/AIG2-like uncharacterized protein YtfP
MEQSATKHLIFVYGTLKSGQRNNWYLRGQTFKGHFRTEPRYRLFDAGTYPLLVPADKGGRAIRGEVYEVDDLALERLDFHEGAPWKFRRAAVEVPGLAGVEAYFFQRSTALAEELADEWPPPPGRHTYLMRQIWSVLKFLHRKTA